MKPRWYIMRQVATDQLRVTRLRRGPIPPPDPAYKWAGPFATYDDAAAAVAAKDESVRAQLYPDAEEAAHA